jgi:hypothetical protein
MSQHFCDANRFVAIDRRSVPQLKGMEHQFTGCSDRRVFADRTRILRDTRLLDPDDPRVFRWQVRSAAKARRSLW